MKVNIGGAKGCAEFHGVDWKIMDIVRYKDCSIYVEATK